MSRYAGGVRVLRLSPEAHVVTFARAEHDDEEEIEAVDTTITDAGNASELEAQESEIEVEDEIEE